MKGPSRIPSKHDLELAYNLFEENEQLSSSLLAQLEWLRFDPRLAEIVVGYFFRNWPSINPLDVNSGILKLAWPESAGPVFEHVRLALPKGKHVLFDSWRDCAMAGIRPGPWQLYWIGLFAIGKSAMTREVEQGNRLFGRWGYYASDIVMSKALRQNLDLTVVNKLHRFNILAKLFQVHTSLTVNDYMFAIENRISRRTAQMDLANFAKATGKGFTRRRKYTRTNTT